MDMATILQSQDEKLAVKPLMEFRVRRQPPQRVEDPDARVSRRPFRHVPARAGEALHPGRDVGGRRLRGLRRAVGESRWRMTARANCSGETVLTSVDAGRIPATLGDPMEMEEGRSRQELGRKVHSPLCNGGAKNTQTTGWLPACDAGRVPATVFDPFGGSGTVGFARRSSGAGRSFWNSTPNTMARQRTTHSQ